jgi:hypothetical protein
VEEAIMTARDVDGWLPFVDAYVDGTLDDKTALRLGLAAEKSPELKAEIERARSFHAALASMPVEAPAGSFDERVLTSVPYQRYASAPRRSPIVVVLGELTPSPVQRAVQRLGGAVSAVAAAWLLAVALGSTAWQAHVAAAGARIGAGLQGWAVSMDGTAVIGPVARILSAAYDAAFGAFGSVAGTMGLGLTIFVSGVLLGALALWMAARRRAAGHDRSAHHA